MSRGKDDEVREVVAELDGLLEALKKNVADLSAILGSHEGEQEGAPA